MPRIALFISIADEAQDQIAEVVARLQKSGLEVDQVLKSLGVVTGTIDEEGLADIRKVAGVGQVSIEQAYRIPPPDSEVG